jgi:hypothetical protein
VAWFDYVRRGLEQLPNLLAFGEENKRRTTGRMEGEARPEASATLLEEPEWPAPLQRILNTDREPGRGRQISSMT